MGPIVSLSRCLQSIIIIEEQITVATFWTMNKCGLSIPIWQKNIKSVLKGNNVRLLRSSTLYSTQFLNSFISDLK